MKPFRLSKNHNNTGIFDKENGNLENPNDNAQDELQNNNMNQIDQQNVNPQNINHILIIPIGPHMNDGMEQNNLDGMNQINDADME